MKVIIAGSRSIDDHNIIFPIINKSPFEITEVVSGMAKGVDQVGTAWALYSQTHVQEFIPDWSIGKHAGFLRNSLMADYADALITIWDGKSKGTEHMISEMIKRKKPIFLEFV